MAEDRILQMIIDQSGLSPWHALAGLRKQQDFLQRPVHVRVRTGLGTGRGFGRVRGGSSSWQGSRTHALRLLPTGGACVPLQQLAGCALGAHDVLCVCVYLGWVRMCPYRKGWPPELFKQAHVQVRGGPAGFVWPARGRIAYAPAARPLPPAPLAALCMLPVLASNVHMAIRAGEPQEA